MFPPLREGWLITSESEYFSTRNFMNFSYYLMQNLAKVENLQDLQLGSRDMTIFGE